MHDKLYKNVENEHWKRVPETKFGEETEHMGQAMQVQDDDDCIVRRTHADDLHRLLNAYSDRQREYTLIR